MQELQKTKYPMVSIIVLNWNGKEETIECIESLKNIKYPNYEVIVVDNGSTDGSVEILSKKYPNIKFIKNKENLGYAEGNNIGIRQAIKNKSIYVLLLNNDTVVDPNLLNELVNVAENDEKIGVVGPTIYNYNNKNKIQSCGAKLNWYTSKTKLLRENEIEDGKSNEIVDVDYVSGCAFLVKCELFKKIGFLCKDYFAYREEVELCVRAKRNASYKIVCAQKAKIWHKGHVSSNKLSGFAEYHITRNNFWFMKQYATKFQYISFLIYFFGYFLWLKCGITIYRNEPKMIIKLLEGVKDGITKNVVCNR